MELQSTISFKDEIKVKGIHLTFNNLSYKVENKKYKSQIKEREKERKKKNKDIENSFGDISGDLSKNEKPIEKEITILDNVSGVIESGALVGLMGPSGCGKSTLLDILAQRKSTGKITGQLLVNGKEKANDFKMLCAYVTQEDALIVTSTVFETIKFFADLKLPYSSENEKIEIVKQVIEDIGLTNQMYSKIGGVLPGGIIIKGLSGGEKRRVGIGCGLITNPSLILLDEPTSGLDSVTALQIMKTLLKLTNKGVTVICSIHQPRPEIYDLFNSFMVLIKGRMIYSGQNVLDYFSTLGYTCPPHINPADYILDSAVLMGESEQYNEICDKWYKNNKIPSLKSLNNDESTTLISSINISIDNDVIKTTWTFQYWILLKRAWNDFIRNTGNSISRVVTGLIIGLIFGAVFAGLKESDSDIQKIIGTLFFLITGLTLSPFAIIPLFLSGRYLFNAERASKIYHSFPYYLATITVELFIEFLYSLIEVSITYMIARLRWDADHFFFALLVLYFIHIIANFIILTYANITCTSDLTFSYSCVTAVILLLFSGFYVPTNQLPKAFGWVHWINPIFYSFSSLMINEFKDLPLKCGSNNSTCIYNNGNQVIEYYGLEEWSRGGLFGIVAAWTLFLFTTSYLTLHYLNKEKR